MVAVNECGAGAEAGVMEGAVGAPSTSGIEADVMDTVPKTMQAKAKRLMENLKRYLLDRSRRTDPRRCAGCRK